MTVRKGYARTFILRHNVSYVLELDLGLFGTVAER